MTVVRLEGAVRRYDWGSRTAVPELLGVEPDGRPVAELWFGTHPDDPSPVPDHGTTLDAVVAADPVAALGAPLIERFGERLPFLLKVLAADKALSIQVHPTIAEATAGFAAEDAEGIARDAPERNYRDRNHKPELLCALTPFEALCGFRAPAATAALLDELDVPELGFLQDALHDDDPLRTAFTALLMHDEPGALVDALVAAVGGLGRHSALARTVELTALDYPGDVGVVLALLLNYVRLEPGEAIFLAAGNVHAYLRGMGVEIMANSDNVLRCGLTGKHVDVAELLEVASFTELADPLWPLRDGMFEVPVADFRLLPFAVDGRISLGDAEPWVVLCDEGAVTVGGVALTPGQAAFVPASDESVPILGRGHVFAAAAGLPPVIDAEAQT
ncbi:mannose-6-phosphate isomerase, class I [Jatrophihabitans endophyticus]|uniref:mannose-6-phosphate isomerase, class I n=1 Tax=Jatrophihabitans endophyticus TaxID=1206085 RepID=UPI0019EB166D|nr:mannose-6-phosphate isomerase, class I [Jatrophihabitans endophyticus]MBE7187132.1 mannose-6-phosphate isomerase, class I [Jatrophihabitans endophyticus]